MNMFRTLLLSVTLFAAAIVATPKAQAQSGNYGVTTLLTGGTNNVVAATTNSTYSLIIDCKKFKDVALEADLRLTGSGSTSVVFILDESVDGAHWKAAAHRFSATVNASTTNTTVTNIQVLARGYLRLSGIENANATALTNILLYSAVKSER